jgi:membrane protease YdiL (CAAX protease family)
MLSLLGILPCIYAELRWKRITISHFVTPPKKGEWKYLLYFIPLIIASLGLSWLLDFILYQVAPGLLESRNLWMEQNPIFNPSGDSWYIIMVLISVCIVAPLAEEFLFRGIIFDKIRNRWAVFIGLITSSFLFGILNFNIFGAFFFGVVLCILYLETESLFIPIGIHFLNNFFALALRFILSNDWSDTSDANYLFDYLWLDIPLLIIGVLWLAWFLYSRRSYLNS